ncbi:MAG: DUF4097 family beta strand repeat protein [Ruminococcus sp.]|uniref:DUF4097 family beta strand repeat-containing protein n=1 Tax=Ruminococcus sp. TaxID=41978 RepID=UPI002872EB21|nr:DUF4097 family beta strand repeat-containing protein [Ruminococcus sp.]MBQ3284429.1 DUF4097 family beta strand repeat protein [Ruminococcus sp.]
MSRTAKIWLIIAGILVVLGPILIVCATAANGNFGKQEYKTVAHEVGSTFDQIAVDTNVTDITIATADEKQCKVICAEPVKMKHTAQVENGTLVICSSDTRKWYENLFSFTFKNPKITVFLPQTEYASLQINARTGDVRIPSGFTFDTLTVNGSTADVECSADATDLNIKLTTGNVVLHDTEAGKAAIETSTGNIRFDSVTAKGNISVKATTGDITLKDTIAENDLRIQSSTGCVRFEGCDASDISVKTSTGDVTGYLLSDKVFITATSTGDVNVPKTTSGGKCEITTSTGDIQFDIKNK